LSKQTKITQMWLQK